MEEDKQDNNGFDDNRYNYHACDHPVILDHLQGTKATTCIEDIIFLHNGGYSLDSNWLIRVLPHWKLLLLACVVSSQSGVDES